MIGTLLLLAAGALNITPAPQELIEEGKGAFIVQAFTPVVVSDDVTEAELAAVDAFLQSIHADLPVVRASQIKSGGEGIYVGEPARHAAFEKRPLRTQAEIVAGMNPGGYLLSIGRKMVVLAGHDAEGTYYGLQTLAQIAQVQPQGWPCLDIRDWPDRAWRGVWTDKPLSDVQQEALRAAKANCVVFDSPEFAVLDAAQADRWRNAFATARRARLEPIPVLRFLHQATALLRNAPTAAEGCVAVDDVPLSGEDWAALSQRNVLPELRVSVSDRACREREDYMLEPGALEWPYAGSAGPCLIRSLPGGSIPDGATARVIYSYAPEYTHAMCPSAPETARALQDAMRRLAETLHPRYVHLGMESIARLNQDLRCLNRKKNNTELVSDALAMAVSIVEKTLPGTQCMMWIDAICPAQDAPLHGTQRTPVALPENMVLTARMPAGARQAKAVRDFCQAQARPYIVLGAPPNSPESTASGACCGALCESRALAEGTAEAFLARAWNAAHTGGPWPEGLNALFDAALTQPAYPERFTALVHALNERTLMGKSPSASYAEFRAVAESLTQRLPKDDLELAAVDKLYANLTNYLTLEQAYSEKPDTALLRRLAEVVHVQAALDPELIPERVQRILDTIQNQGLFVPASILFGGPLPYFRPVVLPTGSRLLEVPAKPTYKDDPQRARAEWDLGAPFALRRIDYETINARQAALECSDDGATFRKIREWNASGKIPVRGPAIIDQMPPARYVRLSIESENRQAVLRETRLYALKGPAAARCPFTATAGRTRFALSSVDWSGAPQAAGFVDAAAMRFAEAPTEVRLCRTKTHLFFGITAQEPRMHAMTADMTARDEPLWEQESVEIWIDTGAGALCRFALNPLGAQCDSRGADPAWNPAWQAITEKKTDRWTAVAAIPLEALGGAPKPGAQWRVNFVRNRANVARERSLWACGADAAAAWPMGALTFE